MSPEEYLAEDMTGLAALVARGDVSADEVLDAAIAREDAVNPGLNAIAQQLHDHGRQAIRDGLPDGPLTGAPYLLKDVGAALKGAATRYGSRMFPGRPAKTDAEIVRRLKSAGAVIFGKTTTPELGLAASTETTLTGNTRNPWDPDRSPGGSSGGAGAAVAGGIVPAAHASDGGGSIRIPASHCGLFGLKPSRARVSFAPEAGDGWGGLACQHALTRTVRDSALLLDVTAGHVPGDPYTAPPPSGPFRHALERPPGKLRIALTTESFTGIGVDKVCVKAAEDAAKMLEDMGHEVVEARPDFEWEEFGLALWTLVAANVARAVHKVFAEKKRKPRRRDMERVTWGALRHAKTLTAEDYADAIAVKHRLGRVVGAFHHDHDLILTPTLGAPPPRIGRQHMNDTRAETYETTLFRMTAFTQLSNLTGNPAMSLPLARTKSGLPVGVMLSAPLGREERLFSLAAAVETAYPWPRLPPDGRA